MSRINSALIRRINIARVFHALREHPGSSQRSLCCLTRLDASTVSTVVAGLEAEGIVRRISGKRSGTAGRPEALLEIAPDGGVLIGAAIGSDSIRLIACRLSGETLASLHLPPGKTVAIALRQLQSGVLRLLGGLGLEIGDVRGIGVGQHGLIDREGHLILAPRLGWQNVALAAKLQALFPVPVYLENDTKAAALAENVFGACRGVADFVLIHGGSGVGGALHLQGALYNGAGMAAEIGHMKVIPAGRLCGCGASGCLEAYVAEPAILARLAEQGHVFADAAAIAVAAATNPVVQAVLDDAGEMLGFAMANLINLLNPRRVVLAGSLATLHPYFRPRLQATLAVNTLPNMCDQVEIIVSGLGPKAVELGGVALAMEGFLPFRARSENAAQP